MKTTIEIEKELKEKVSKYFVAKNSGAKGDTLNKRADLINRLANKYEYSGKDKWINAFKNGEMVTNKFGKHLFFKLAF